MVETKRIENLDLGGHEVGYVWVAGKTPPNDSSPGEWIVEYDGKWWRVLFRSTPTHVAYIIQAFSPDNEGERAAKGMANKLVDNAWESYRNNPRQRIRASELGI
jgi:hypothetical protein